MDSQPQQDKLFESREWTDEIIPIPEDKMTTVNFKSIDIGEYKVFVLLVPLDKIASELIDLSACVSTASDNNIIVIVLYLEEAIIQEIDDDDSFTFKMLEDAIVSSRYYVMIEIDKISVYTIREDIEKTELPLLCWIDYSNLVESHLTGVIGVIINRKIILRSPITIHASMDDFKSKMLENLNNIPSHLEEQREILSNKIEEVYSMFRLSLEESCNVPIDHPFLISSTTNGKIIYEHPLFDCFSKRGVQEWIVNTSVWHTT